MKSVQYFLLVLMIQPILGAAFAAEEKSVEKKILPEDVCKSIDSNKYETQCNVAIQDGYFHDQAVLVCYQQTTNYDKKSCMEVIRGKDYTATQLTNCKNGKKERLMMCLKLNGELRKVNAPADEIATPVEN